MDERRFSFQFGRIRKALRREFESRTAVFDITVAQFQVLLRLWSGDGLLTTVLAAEISSDCATITGVLDRLEGRGLIRRERCAEDRRAVRIFLTDSGRALEEPLMAALTAVEEQALEGLTPADRAELLRLLARVGGNLGA